MRLLSLDYDPVYGDKETTRSDFSGDLSAFDYDVVIWDPAESFKNYVGSYPEHYQGLPSLSDHNSVAIKADVERRRSEFIDFINSGRTLVVIARPPQECYVATGQHNYSGSGRNRVDTRMVTKFDLLRGLPVSGASYSIARGDRIELDGDGPIVDVLRKYKKFMAYDTIVTDPPGSILAHVSGTDRVVGFIQRTKAGGHLILIPHMNLQIEQDDEDEEEYEPRKWVKEAPEFQEDLLDAISQLTGGVVVVRPAWAERYATESQKKLRDEVVKQQARIESNRLKLARLQKRTEEAESRDQLYLGSGRALELEVKSVMELLGGTVSEPSPGRDDWKVAFPEGDAVIEAKGVKKSAAEKFAAQLEKWVAGSLEESGKAAKGILVVNTWRDIPLSDRTGIDFPAQMIPYSKSRGHCLVTGLQLFIMRSEIEKNPIMAESFRQKILETSGVLDGLNDWTSIVQVTESQA